MQLRPLTYALFIAQVSFFFAVPALSAPLFHIRLSSPPDTLDWNNATTGSESAIIQNIMRGLFIQDTAGLPQLDLAKNYHWSADGKELTVELRQDVKWVDGRSLESRNFLDSFARLLNPNLNSENASLFFDIQGARDFFLGKIKSFEEVGIKAPSKHVLILKLNEPRANFLSILTHWSTFPVRSDHLKLTLGAYKIVTLTKDSIRLQATQASTRIQQAEFNVVPSGSEALAQFRSKKLDYLLQLEDSLLNPLDLKGLPEPGFVDPSRVVALLHLNPSRVVTNSPEKRRAVMNAIPLAELTQENPKTRAKAPSLIPAGMLGGPEVQDLRSFSAQNSKIALPTEGLSLAYPNDAFSKSIAETIQRESKKLKIKIEALPPGELSNASKRYDLVLTLFGLDYGDPDQLLSSFLTQGTHDLFNLSSAEFLQTIQRARATQDLKLRGQIYQEAADYLENKIAIVMPLFYRRRSFLLRTGFSFDDKRQGTVVLSRIHSQK